MPLIETCYARRGAKSRDAGARGRLTPAAGGVRWWCPASRTTRTRGRSPDGRDAMARTMTCDCGQTLTGADDEELARQGRQHVQQVHPDMAMTDEQLRQVIASRAKDAG